MDPRTKRFIIEQFTQEREVQQRYMDSQFKSLGGIFSQHLDGVTEKFEAQMNVRDKAREEQDVKNNYGGQIKALQTVRHEVEARTLGIGTMIAVAVNFIMDMLLRR